MEACYSAIALLDAASHGDDADADGVSVLSPRLHFNHHHRVWTSACLSGWSIGLFGPTEATCTGSLVCERYKTEIVLRCG